MIVEPHQIVLRRAELAEGMARPTQPNFNDAPQPPCERCGRPLDELFITTGGPLGDPDVWRDHPIAVDGWACTTCGVFRYPRRMEPAQITAFGVEGSSAGRAGDFATAEQYFARIVWDWPGYMVGHLNYAEATRDRLHHAKPDDAAVRRRLEARYLEHYEAAVMAFVSEPTPAAALPSIVRAILAIADSALAARAFDRAARVLALVDMFREVPEALRADTTDRWEYIRTRRFLVEDAFAVVGSRIRLVGRDLVPPSTQRDRDDVTKAIEGLEEHLALAPDRWQSLWLYAKALHVIGRDADAFTTWTRAFATHPAQPELAQDYSIELLFAGRTVEAREVARTHAQHAPDNNSQAWANLAVTELLCGDLAATEAAVTRSLAQDPADKVALLLQSRLETYRAGAPLPTSMAELERG